MKKYKFFLFSAIFCLLGFFVSITSIGFGEAITYLALSIILFVLYFKVEKKPKRQEPSKTEEAIPLAKPISTVKKAEIGMIKQSLSSPNTTTQKNSPHYKFENHRVAGTSYYQKEIASLAEENPVYDWSKKELIDDIGEDEKIYRYEFNPKKVELIEEPDNPHDPNAIKVIIDDILVGYIKKGSCNRVRNLLRANSINRIDVEITGGPYKIIYCDYDEDEDKDVYTLEKDSSDYFVTISLRIPAS